MTLLYRSRFRSVIVGGSSGNGAPLLDLAIGLWENPPDLYLFMDGQKLNRADFPDLWEVCNNWKNRKGMTWKSLFGLNETSVWLPHSGADYIRAAGEVKIRPDVTIGIELGEWQDSQNLAHTHGYAYPYYGQSVSYPGGYSRTLIGFASTGSSGGAEARPRTRAYNFALKVLKG